VNLWVESNLGADILDLQWRARNGLSQSGAIPDPAAKILLERLGFGIEKSIAFNEKTVCKRCKVVGLIKNV
jgi:hypothetical protein